MTETNKYLVSIRCLTFNHAPFIVDAMKGFAIQETNFPFVCTIIDDNSADGEQAVINHYLQEHFDLQDKSVARNEETDDYRLIFARHKTNINCFFAVLFLKYNHFRIKKSRTPYIAEWNDNVKYIAYCEGDDYWITSDKLQKQVDYLETNPNISICVHNANKFICDTGETVPFNSGLISQVFSIEQVIKMKWFTPTASIMYRSVVTVDPIWTKRGCNFDMALLFSNLLKGDMYYDSDSMCVYRYGTPSSLSKASDVKVLYKKKLNLYKTLNIVSKNKYWIDTTLQILKLNMWLVYRRLLHFYLELKSRKV